MPRRKTKSRAAAAPAQPASAVPEPVDVVDGIADRSGHPARWKILLLALIFLLWVAFLVYCGIAGAP